MIPRMIRAGRQALCLQSFYTAGPKEVRAWTIMKGTLAPQAAGVIHSDFERGFIKAEVCAFEDFKELHKGEASMAKIKEAGKYRQEGKNYVMQEGDIVGTFVFVWSECYYGACADCRALTHTRLRSLLYPILQYSCTTQQQQRRSRCYEKELL
jgi:Protein of unknown function (DUF933)